MGINFNIGVVILASVLLLAAHFAYRRTTPSISTGYRAALLTLRIAAFLAIALLLMDPRWIYDSKRTEAATAIALIDRSASMGLPLSRGAAGATRLEEAQRLSAELESAVESRGGKYTEAFFSSDLLSASTDTVDAEGQGTDIEQSLRSLHQKYEGENLAAVILISDGVDTEDRLVRGATLPVPVFAVGLGDTTAPEDVRIQDVDYNSIVRAPSRTVIEATISHTGNGIKPVVLRLREEGRVVFEQDTLLTTSVREIAVNIPLEFKEPGRRSFVLEAVAMAGDDEEAENNRRDIVIEAEKAGVKILIVDLTPQWEVHFLTDFLRNDDTFDFDLISGFGNHPSLRDGHVLSAESFVDDLKDYDALVVASINDRFLDDRVTAAIKDFVLDSGKGLLVMPGPSSLYERRQAWSRLSDILPVRGNAPHRFQLQFTAVRPGAQAGSNPITSELVPLLSQTDWQQRTPLLGYYASLIPKTGVEVLLETDGHRAPAFIYQSIGKGRVAMLSVGPLWRWKFLADGNTLYDEMVSRLLDVLSRGEATERFLLFSKKNVYDSGEEATITAEIFNEKMQPVTGVPVKIEIARITDDGSEVPLQMVAMEREGSDNPRFRSVLPPLPPGNYRISGAAELPERTIAPQPIEISVSEVSVEFQNVTQDRDNLIRIAGQSGGSYRTPGDVADLARRMALPPRVVETTVEMSLRTNLFVFSVIVLLLGVEWIIRKRAGMI
jgi:hypothetical protein